MNFRIIALLRFGFTPFLWCPTLGTDALLYGGDAHLEAAGVAELETLKVPALVEIMRLQFGK